MADRATVDAHTFDIVKVDSPEGRKFLRRVIRENRARQLFGTEWQLRAAADTDWCVEYSRTVKGKAVGDPDSTVTVRTDVHIGQRGNRGPAIQAFHDAEPVCVLEPRAVYLHGDAAALLARWALDGAGFYISSSAGSVHTSRMGLAFYELVAQLECARFAHVSIGGESITAHGRMVTSGPVHV